MKITVLAISALLLAGAAGAHAEGPRTSSGTGWAGISQPLPPATSAGEPHFVWQEGYDHAGKWRGHWVVVR